MMDDKYRPRSIEEMVEDPIPVTIINEVATENVGVLVPGRQRSLHAVVAQNLAETLRGWGAGGRQWAGSYS
jgi:hypothetical protein